MEQCTFVELIVKQCSDAELPFMLNTEAAVPCSLEGTKCLLFVGYCQRICHMQQRKFGKDDCNCVKLYSELDSNHN